jgi:hypothetical protein
MTGEVIAFKDLRVAPQGEIMDYTFYNKRFLEIASAINDLAVRQDGYDATSQNLIALGLQRINDTLGPFLTSLQQASQLGFLVCEATGLPVTLQVGVDVQFIVNSDGKSVFTPTPWLLAMDENDYTNWGILSFTAYSPTTGVLAGHTIFTTQNKTSARWSISCNSAMIAAETNLLNQAQAAANQANSDAANVKTLITQVTQLIQIVQTGPVVSVAGRNGAVVLSLTDVIGLTDALLQKAAVSDLTTGLATKQPLSAMLTTFAALGGAADRLPYFTGVGAMALAALTQFARNLIATPDAPSARLFLGLGDIATHPSSDFMTPAQVQAQITAQVPNTWIYGQQIIGSFDDQTLTSYELTAVDNGKTVTLNNAAAITAFLRNDNVKGWNAMILQLGAGQVTISAEAGATLRNRQNQFKTAGLYAVVSILCISNTTGTNAVYVIGGDTAL